MRSAPVRVLFMLVALVGSLRCVGAGQWVCRARGWWDAGSMGNPVIGRVTCGNRATAGHPRRLLAGGPGPADPRSPRTRTGIRHLAAYLTDRYLDREHSLVAIARELGVTIHVVRSLRDALGIGSHGGVRARGRSRQAANDQRAAACVAALGFASLHEYLTDRYADRAWTIPQLAAELCVG